MDGCLRGGRILNRALHVVNNLVPIDQEWRAETAEETLD